MTSKHCDPHNISSSRQLTPCMLKTKSKLVATGAARNASESSAATARQQISNSTKETGLLVTRELYKVLDQERSKQRVSTKPAKSRGSSGCSGRSSRPNFIICYLCGLEFSAGSLPIHQPQCYVKKLIEWERMDPSMRGAKPPDPETHERLVKEGRAQVAEKGTIATAGNKLKGADLDWLNSMHFKEFTNTALLPCGNCGRKFLPASLEVHRRSCKPGSASASKPVLRFPGSSIKPQKAATVSPKLSSRFAALTTPADASRATKEEQRVVAVATKAALAQNVGAEGLLPCEAPYLTSEGVVLTGGNPATEADCHVDAPSPNGDSSIIEVFEVDARQISPNSPLNVEDKTAESGEKGAAAAYGDEQLVSTKAAAAGKQKKKDSATSDVCATKSKAKKLQMGSCVGIDNFTCEVLPTAEEFCIVNNNGPFQEKQAPKIKMNNVSRFKNVPSRLRLERQKNEQLPRCRYCNRTFNADRIDKHESVCLERKNTAPKNANSTNNAATLKEKKKNVQNVNLQAESELCESKGPGTMSKQKQQQAQPQPTSPPSDGEKEKAQKETAQKKKVTAGGGKKSAASNDLTDKCVSPSQQETKDAEGKESDLSTKQCFCFDCGAKLLCTSQRFCSECGTKLQ